MRATGHCRRLCQTPSPGVSQKRPTGHHMSVIGIGVDVIECSRIQHSIERFGDRFLHRVFTEGEIEYSMSMKFPERHLAARFAGKEAVSKAFGTGIGKAMGWRNIDIRKRKAANLFWFFQDRRKRLRQNEASLRRLSHSANGKSGDRVRRSRRRTVSSGIIWQFKLVCYKAAHQPIVHKRDRRRAQDHIAHK